jgi:hypothetical protein
MVNLRLQKGAPPPPEREGGVGSGGDDIDPQRVWPLGYDPPRLVPPPHKHSIAATIVRAPTLNLEGGGGAEEESEEALEVVVLVVRGFGKGSPSVLSSWLPGAAAKGRMRPLEKAWLERTFGRWNLNPTLNLKHVGVPSTVENTSVLSVEPLYRVSRYGAVALYLRFNTT